MTAASIALKDKYTLLLSQYNNSNYSNLLNKLFTNSYITKNKAASLLDISYPTASNIVDEFVKHNILTDVTPNRQRNKRYCFAEYVDILVKGTELNNV